MFECALVREERQGNDRLEVARRETVLTGHRQAMRGVVFLRSGEHDVAIADIDALAVSPSGERVVLLGTEQFHVPDPLLPLLDVAVEHRCIRVEAEFMCCTMCIEPLIRSDLALEGLVMDNADAPVEGGRRGVDEDVVEKRGGW